VAPGRGTVFAAVASIWRETDYLAPPLDAPAWRAPHYLKTSVYTNRKPATAASEAPKTTRAKRLAI